MLTYRKYFRNLSFVASPPALVHDYLTQRGGAERVVLSMLRAFPSAPLHTSLFDPEGTFPEFSGADVRALRINRIAAFRRNHRLALPLLARAYSGLVVDAPVVLCSSTGWAHGAGATGRKIVYCHNPARWLYQSDQYLGAEPDRLRRTAVRVMAKPLIRWDRRAAHSAHRYLVNSTIVRQRVQDTYGIEAEVLHPPPAYSVDHPQEPVDLDGGYWLTVSRLLPYKNVDRIIRAFESLPGERLVVVGRGPDHDRLQEMAPANVSLLGGVSDNQLAWIYAHCQGLVTASYEDFGLTPLEANVYGKPVVALAWGGHLDTVEDGLNGVRFDHPEPELIAQAVRRAVATGWSVDDIQRHAARFSETAFIKRLRQVVAEEATEAGM